MSLAGSIARQNHVLQNRIDLVLPALAGKDAVVPDAGLHVVALEIGAQLAAQVVRSHRLADGANVVALALDGEQHGAPDRRAGRDSRADRAEAHAPGR